jgi:hypothetical protein
LASRSRTFGSFRWELSLSELMLVAAPRLAFGDVHFCVDAAVYRSSAVKRAPSECGIALDGLQPTVAR